MPYVNEELMKKIQQEITGIITNSKYSVKDYELADQIVEACGKPGRPKDYNLISDEDSYGLDKGAQMARDPRPMEIDQAVAGDMENAENWIQTEVVDKGRTADWLGVQMQKPLGEGRIESVWALVKGMASGGFYHLQSPEIAKVKGQLGNYPGNMQKFLEKKTAEENGLDSEAEQVDAQDEE